MAIQAYADGVLFYDSMQEGTDLLGLSITSGVNVSGTATFVLPPQHAAYNFFVGHKTLVEIVKDGALKFRGRALYPSDDFYNRRTITCEGERGFFRDAIHRAYVYQKDPASIFADVMAVYNSQVDAFKRFVVGTVDVTDPNDYILLEASEAETVADVVNKLVERCGGYIVFTTNTSGERVVNWYTELGYRSEQVIEFGENLLDFSRSDGSEELYTVLIPYGAKDEESGKRVTIESENDGVDYIENAEAVALRGRIVATKIWDDVTVPHNLLMKAQAALAQSSKVVTSLELSAVDLSNIDKSIDVFEVGDLVRVISAPHGVDDYFLLQNRTEDLLNPANDTVTLGKEAKTLTGSDVAGDRGGIASLLDIERRIRSDYQIGTAKSIGDLKLELSSLIEQTERGIMQAVSETYATNEGVESYVGTLFTQLKNAFDFSFSTLEKTVDENDAEARAKFIEIEKHITFEDGDIVLNASNSTITLRIENDTIAFYDEGAKVAYITDKQLVITDGRFLNSLRIGNFAFLPRKNGNLSLVKVG